MEEVHIIVTAHKDKAVQQQWQNHPFVVLEEMSSRVHYWQKAWTYCSKWVHCLWHLQSAGTLERSCPQWSCGYLQKESFAVKSCKTARGHKQCLKCIQTHWSWIINVFLWPFLSKLATGVNSQLVRVYDPMEMWCWITLWFCSLEQLPTTEGNNYRQAWREERGRRSFLTSFYCISPLREEKSHSFKW